MDSQDAAASDRRQGNAPTITEDAAKVPADSSPAKTTESGKNGNDRTDANKKMVKEKRNKKQAKSKAKKPKKTAPVEESSTESASDDAVDSPASSDSDTTASESDSEGDAKRKRVARKRLEAKKSKKNARSKKTKRHIKTQPAVSDSEDSEESDSESLDESEDEDVQGGQDLAQQLLQLQLQQQMHQQVQQQHRNSFQGYGGGAAGGLSQGLGQAANSLYISPPVGGERSRTRRGNNQAARTRGLGGLDPSLMLDGKRKPPPPKQKRGKSSRLDYKRVDQVWDNAIHNYKLQDTTESTTESQYDEYVLQVRRTFDWEGKYKTTVVDIKSKLLREGLQEVMGNIKGVSLVEETPKLDPNMLFLYLQDIRAHLKQLKKAKPTGADKHERKKDQKRNESKRQHLKVLLKYLKKDYGHVEKSLNPLLENGLITFDLLWALWKPNTLAYTTTYGSQDEPRAFKVEMAEKHFSIVKGDFYYIEGKYFEYDGKQFGFGSMSEEIGDFRGARKITSLNCYPIQYHKNVESLRKDLIERGKKFVQLGGVHYKSHQGMAYYKKKKSVIKVNINGRIMVDPAIHRRINPNYPISLVRPKDHDLLSDDSDEDEESECGCNSDSDLVGINDDLDDDEKIKYVTKAYRDANGTVHTVRVPKSEVEDSPNNETLDKIASKDEAHYINGDDRNGTSNDAENGTEVPVFTDEEYLIASPVLLGFAFAEKLWLEFTVSGVKEIQWNENAYESLVLEPKTKDIVKALVESHKYHAAESIDDVIQGKGKGLVAVLHGPPGTGKTLTAEGISELLKCPLYMVSAGELGTDSRYLESELQKILDICHAWGAILLLDEADVFLEKRNMHDIHRNALVSIFLRQLEYFQGILFLTTNRVETFDDAFQSRIHIALRYDDLDQRAKKTIFKIFIERVRVLEKIDLMPFSEEDYTILAKNDLNGRQIKNTVRTAQALAVNKGEPLSMKHIRQVLDVLTSFDRDLKGGTGYQDAMRSYF